jgi:hypothetical protein
MSAGSRPGDRPRGSARSVSGTWEPEHRVDLDSDVYTLRRIVLADHGVDSGDI